MTSGAKALLAPLTESKLPIVYAKGSLRFRQIKLDTALAGFEVNLEGGGGADFVFFDESSTAQTGATMTIDDESSTAKLPVGPLRGFRDLPCKRVFITCAALSGGILNMWYGKGAFLYGVMPAGKGAWYDRNPVTKINSFISSTVVAHAATTRWTYTVPTAKKFMLQIGDFAMTRDAAGTAAAAGMQFYITPSGGALTLSIDVRVLNAAVDTSRQRSIAGTAIFPGGDALRLDTFDTGGAGSFTYNASAAGIEFDA